MRWWRWWRRDLNGTAAKAAEEEAKLRRAERATPIIEQLAPKVAELPDDEFAARVARAFAQEHRRRHA